MPSLSGLTLDQLRAATKAQIVARIDTWLANHTKREIIEMLLEVVQVSDDPAVAYHPDGQVKSQTTVSRDVLGAKTGSRQVSWTYYPEGEVDVVTLVELDASDVETSRRTIKHYLDGRQPTVA